TIQYHVKVADRVKLKVYNALGQEVATLVDEFRNPGTYSLNWDAKGLASGTYYYRLEVGDQALPAKKALFIK
ncbi:T9SS type A sorting domain-containing protein, partial [bacterium]|nr:T9SS type A sorting domain-containing protein [bacterium]